MNKITTCNFSDNLISKMADFAFDNFLSKGVEPPRLCFVFGGRRPSLFLKKELALRVKKSILSPSFFTMEDFMKEAVLKNENLSFMPDIEAAYLIYSLIKKNASGMLGKRETFAEYLPWAYEILSFINQADMEDVKQKAFENIEANAELGYDIPANINELLRNISALREAFHGELSKKKMITRGLLYQSAGEKAGSFDKNKYDAVIFGNLFYLHKTEEKVVKAVFDSGKGILFFQGDSSDWSVLKKLEKLFSCEIKPENSALRQKGGQAPPDISLYCGYDRHSQASIARHIIGSFKNVDNSVLILPDSDTVMPVITEISSTLEDFNVSLGYPVSKSSMFSLLEAVFAAQESRKNGEYYARDYLKVVLHPLAKNLRLPFDPAVTRALIHKVEEILTTKTGSSLAGSLFINLDDVIKEEGIYSGLPATGKDELINILKSLNNILFKMWEDVKSFIDLDEKTNIFANKIAEKSFAQYYPLNSKTIESLLEISAELKNASFAGAVFSKEDILKIFLKRLADEFVSFPGTPLKGFQVLGLLESRSLSFENVIILDANETKLPKLKVSEPLIPREVMLGLGINRVEKEEEIQRYEFFRLIKGAKNAHIVYSVNEKNERSRFVEELLWEREKTDKNFRFKTSTFGFRAEASNEKKSFEKLPEVMSYLKTMKYSATKINAYLHCPLQFYFQYVLKIKEKEAYSDEPDASEIGTFLHNFLYKIFSGFIGQKPVYDGAFEGKFSKSLRETFDETFLKRMKAGSFLVKEVVDHRMERFLENERERNPKKIIALEKTYSGTFGPGPESYSFESRVDRIDELEDGSFLIIDYKTGGTQGLKGHSKLPEDFTFSRESIKKCAGSLQLPVYLNLVKKNWPHDGDSIDAALYDLRASELLEFFKGADAKAREEKTAFYEKALQFILEEINNPSVPFSPDNFTISRCNTCPYFYMCR